MKVKELIDEKKVIKTLNDMFHYWCYEFGEININPNCGNTFVTDELKFIYEFCSNHNLKMEIYYNDYINDLECRIY